MIIATSKAGALYHSLINRPRLLIKGKLKKLSKFKITDEIIEELEEQLTWYIDPIFEKSDIECVVFAFRSRREDGLVWLRYRARLFDNPDIVTFTESVLNGIKERTKTKNS